MLLETLCVVNGLKMCPPNPPPSCLQVDSVTGLWIDVTYSVHQFNTQHKARSFILTLKSFSQESPLSFLFQWFLN